MVLALKWPCLKGSQLIPTGLLVRSQLVQQLGSGPGVDCLVDSTVETLETLETPEERDSDFSMRNNKRPRDDFGRLGRRRGVCRQPLRRSTLAQSQIRYTQRLIRLQSCAWLACR